MFTKNWWKGFYIGHIWVTVGISLINFFLFTMILSGLVDAKTAFMITTDVTCVLILTSVVMSRVVERESDE